jgi:hypothetical protein
MKTIIYTAAAARQLDALPTAIRQQITAALGGAM